MGLGARDNWMSALLRLSLGPFLLVASALVMWRSLAAGLWLQATPGAGLFPFCAGLLLGVAGLGVLAEDGRQGRIPPRTQLVSGLARAGNNLAANLAAIVAFAILIPWVGFVPALILYLIFAIRILARRGWVVAFAVTVVCVGVAVGVFRLWLNLPLPSGYIGI